MSKILKYNQSIEHLNISQNSLKNYDFDMICLGLSENKSSPLKTLDVSDNMITEVGLENFKHLLRENKTPSKLIMENNKIGNGLSLYLF